MVKALWANHWFRRVRDVLTGDLAGFGAALRPSKAPKAGLHSYRISTDTAERHLHLRVASDGSAVLLVDVTEAIHLNPTAAAVAKMTLDGADFKRTWAVLRRDIPRLVHDNARRDAEEIVRAIEHIRACSDGCPTCGLEQLRRKPPFSCKIDVPYKADVALTYVCNNACGHCYNPPARRTMRSLDVEHGRQVIDRLAAIGIPHLVFTGGEPTLVDSLVALIDYARRKNLIVGMNTNGRRLAEPGFARSLADAGLNHVQITIESPRPEVHNAMTGAASFEETVSGIERSLDAGLHTITNSTLTRDNAEDVEELVDFLHGLGLRTIAANGMIHAGCGCDSKEAISEDELAPLLIRLRDRVEELSMRLLWYTPTAYCRLSPLELELGARRCNAAEYSICIEANGDVLPCQSYYEPAGNLLTDRWESIWNGPLFKHFRGRVADPRGCGLPESCWECPDLAICAGGCPLERQKKTRAETPRCGVL